jgi:hypothetical protein
MTTISKSYPLAKFFLKNCANRKKKSLKKWVLTCFALNRAHAAAVNLNKEQREHVIKRFTFTGTCKLHVHASFTISYKWLGYKSKCIDKLKSMKNIIMIITHFIL